MIDLVCPHCGRAGSAPEDKVNSRLVCKKCHMVFHLSPSGRATPGEPPASSSGRGSAVHAAVPGSGAGSGIKRFGTVPLVAVAMLGLAGLLAAGYFTMFR